MGCYPINLQLTGRPCLVIGGGKVAERKVQSLLTAGAVVTVISPKLTAGLANLLMVGSILHVDRPYQFGDVEGYVLAVCATGNQTANREAAAEARDRHVLVNVVDNPELGNFSVPAQVTRGQLLLTVSTGGLSPALARCLREDLAKNYGPEYGQYLEMVAKARNRVKACLETASERGCFWQETLDEETLVLLRQGRMREAEAKINDAIGGIGIKS
jgi:precorrin-2 dehydrogenase / sirohydrochlorin ferrochelatase